MIIPSITLFIGLLLALFVIFSLLAIFWFLVKIISWPVRLIWGAISHKLK